MSKVLNLLSWNVRYVYCVFYKQSRLYADREGEEEKTLFDLYSMSIAHNISSIGNCLGEDFFLNQAISDYEKGVFTIPMDSVSRDKFGKVIYEYN
jgi:hypothetical protein